MKKYMIRFESSSGSLAVEKSMHTYIRENYADCIVTEEGIEKIVDDLRTQISGYLETHRGKPVEVSLHKNAVRDGYFLAVGSVSMNLIAVKQELGGHDYKHGYYKAIQDCREVLNDLGVFEWMSTNSPLDEKQTGLAFYTTMIEKFQDEEGIGLQDYIDKMSDADKNKLYKQLSEPSYIDEATEHIKKKYYDAGHKAGASQTIDKACKWLNENARQLMSAELRQQFKKAMEE